MASKEQIFKPLKVVIEKPPFWKKVIEVFGDEPDPMTAVYTYGDTIYNPGGHELDLVLLAHEQVHARQHNYNTKDADKYLKKYFTDWHFRLECEIEAYRAQYKFFCTVVKDRNARTRFLYKLARDLSTGYALPVITGTDAIRLIGK
jgi:hypothetical protein